MKKAENFFTTEEKEAIINAIQVAEKNTSGEIRVHLENTCNDNVLDRAAFIFEKLQIHKTQKRNGVLFYLSVQDKKFAVLGDAGINAVTPENFWDEIKNTLTKFFNQGDFVTGLIRGIEITSEVLKNDYPYQKNDVDELPNEISFGEN
jgi:uncharacterized membrane protein